MTITEYLEANDGQSLVGSLLLFGFTNEELNKAEKDGFITIGDPNVYLNN